MAFSEKHLTPLHGIQWHLQIIANSFFKCQLRPETESHVICTRDAKCRLQ